MTHDATIPATVPHVVTLAQVAFEDAHTRARNDSELLDSWLASLNSPRTRANFATTARRFLALLARRGHILRTAKLEDVREAIAELADGKSPSSVIQYTQRVKSLLSYAHRLGYLRFNAGAAIRAKGGSVDRAKRIASETGARVGGELYSDALTGPKGDGANYIDMMRHNVRELTKALAP